MKKDDDILARFSKDSGFKVPEGYFSDFSKKMVEMLPEKPVAEEKKPTVWLRIRPWAYMAAMFGGVWCMMYLFSDLKSRSSMEYNEQIAEAMSDEKFVDDYMNYGNIDNYDILEQMYEDGIELGSIDSTIN